jgi:hypothetical protein
MAEAATAVITEDRFPDEVDGDGEQHQSKEQESQQLGCLPRKYPANFTATFRHGEFRYRYGSILAQGLQQVNPATRVQAKPKRGK